MQDYEELISEWIHDPTIGKVIAGILTIIVVVTLVRLSQAGASRWVEDTTARYRVRKVISVLGYVVAVIGLGAVFSDRLSQLTVVLGVAGAGIAFALQEVIASFAGWVAVSLGGFYKIGDRVQLGGIKGDVIDIGFLRTTVVEIGQWVNGDLYNGRVVRVANSFVFKEPVVNYSGDFPFLWDELTVPIRYGSDMKQARLMIQSVVDDLCGAKGEEAEKIWQSMASKYRVEKASTRSMVTFSFDSNWALFTARYVVAFDKRRSVKDAIFTGIYDSIEATGGAIQIASAAIELFPKDDLRVQVVAKSEGD